MNELSTDSPPSQLRVNNTQQSVSPILLSPDSSGEPEVFNRQKLVELLYEADEPPEELTENTNDSNSTIIYNINNEAAVHTWANAEESTNTEHAVNNSAIQSNHDNSMHSDTTSVVLSQHLEADDNECENPAEEPPAKVRGINSPKSDELYVWTCVICLNICGNSGEHRIVSLRCGHWFGSLCVEKWLKAQNISARSCPICKRRVNMKDLRYIYAP